MRKNIITVAKELNLAPSTVSKVLNNNGKVSQKTRDRVMAYVKEVGYFQDASARILKSKRSYTLGILFSDISLVGLEHPFFSSILQSFKNYVEKEAYEIIFVVSKVGEREMSYLEWCLTKKVDGVLLVSGNLNNPYIKELVASDIPCVSTDFIMPNLTTIISDNQLGIDLSIDYGRKLNRNHIDMIAGPSTSIAFQHRMDHFHAVMNKPKDPYFVIEAKGFGFQSGFDAAVRLLEQATRVPDYVIVGSDDLAFGAIRGFESKGYKVPDDISVIGFDDINFARIYSPALTTIRQDKKAIGEMAALKLIQMIQEKESKKTELIKIPVTLIERASTKIKI
jgi:LacI family transcriptional regulator